ncbi:hypothetical protein [Wolbachia pipientis]|uniref:hypothetical protein n=1 Tax=Wolbachia pipientis TaxID=955 RepID=UPI0025A49ED0|nr:hypothetical protein [Wolbachia pipientis]MDM8335104.1 hypothetical protein [Wolbachia pipientis]
MFLKNVKIDNELKSLAYEVIINGNTQDEVLYTEVDNIYFYIRYSHDIVLRLQKL